jgi:hypothetical protein
MCHPRCHRLQQAPHRGTVSRKCALSQWSKGIGLLRLGPSRHRGCGPGHPLLALDIVRSVTERYLMFQTMIFPDAAEPPVPEDLDLEEREPLAAPGGPKLAIVERRLAGDPTNWWVANASCARALLRSSGFEVLESPENETFWCRASEAPDAAREELRVVTAREAPS